MIFDTVDSHPFSKPGILLINELADRLINVAITRAKGKFIMIGDLPYLTKRLPNERLLFKLLQYMKERNAIYQPNEYLKEMIQDKQLIWHKGIDVHKIVMDIKRAKNKLFIVLPTTKEWPNRLWEAINEFRGTVTILTKEPRRLKVKEGVEIIPSHFPFLSLRWMRKVCGVVTKLMRGILFL